MGFAAFLSEIMFPTPLRCVSCGKGAVEEGAYLCPICADALSVRAPIRIPTDAQIARAVAAHPYAGGAGALVRVLKYRNIASLAKRMGDDVSAALRMEGMQPDRVTFVPMHRARRKSKYFNQAELIAKTAAEHLGLRAESLLKRVRRCRQQATLETPEARVQNVRDAFIAEKPLDGARVLLVDDVYTTGATARECAAALLEAGADEVWVAVFALGGG